MPLFHSQRNWLPRFEVGTGILDQVRASIRDDLAKMGLDVHDELTLAVLR